MKIAVCGDIHFGIKYGEIDRREDIRAACRKIINGAIPGGIGAFVIVGDLFHNYEPGNAAILDAKQFLCPIMDRSPIYWLVGNHDRSERESAVSVCDGVMEPLDQHGEEFYIVRELMTVESSGRLWALFLPWLPRWSHPNVQEVLDKAAADFLEDGGRLVFCHLEIPGGTRGPADSFEHQVGMMNPPRLPDIFREHECTIIAGHYHQAQTIQFGESTVHVVGSVERFGFGEQGDEKRFLILDV